MIAVAFTLTRNFKSACHNQKQINDMKNMFNVNKEKEDVHEKEDHEEYISLMKIQDIKIVKHCTEKEGNNSVINDVQKKDCNDSKKYGTNK